MVNLKGTVVNTEKKSSECREWEGGWKAGGGGRLGIGLCTCLTLPPSLIPPTPFSNFLYLSPNTTLVLLSSPRNENGIWHFNLQVLVTECLDCQVLISFSVTKLSIVWSILFIVVQKCMVAFTTAEVLLGITCVGAFLQVLMYLSNTSDPFTYLEKAVAAVLFKEPAEKADTSDAKKKKE